MAAGAIDDHLAKASRAKLVDPPLGCPNLPEDEEEDEQGGEDAGAPFDRRSLRGFFHGLLCPCLSLDDHFCGGGESIGSKVLSV